MINFENQVSKPYENLKKLFYFSVILFSFALSMNANVSASGVHNDSIGPYGGTCMIIEDNQEEEGSNLLGSGLLSNPPSANFPFREDANNIDSDSTNSTANSDNYHENNTNDDSVSHNQSSDQDLGRLLVENNQQNNDSNAHIQSAETDDSNNESLHDDINFSEIELDENAIQNNLEFEGHIGSISEIIQYLIGGINSM